eukprot:CAMPEP_0170547454 /NCGR_PEP_ID=MMETSP0211-20121228/5853_1 /TAXON_ID=311385 /ORGANISM="Pseudokeronopsis sp., Strain OXSARD2" /LENGTH=57 /DNA_ID=CAMNT_0010852513 /DNA_START=377 /DNA_END=550 /DNA_ORIENTATION=-
MGTLRSYQQRGVDASEERRRKKMKDILVRRALKHEFLKDQSSPDHDRIKNHNSPGDN